MENVGHCNGVAPAEDFALSKRERQVLDLLAEGKTNDAIARRLTISPHTVDTYLRRIRAKTGISNRARLIVFAMTGEA